ncbi:MAG: putative Orn/Lys/Arg decarboxylase [Frankiales bacterium]|nr:putative Orn/Lys/Arg decarboxylase [Frankiales bacterium]
MDRPQRRYTDVMNQGDAPLLDALADYHRANRYGFTPPGHRLGRGTDPRVRDVLGEEPFRADVLASSGLDDRHSSGALLEKAEQLMAEAVGAEHAFFSTCGSSLSVKAAMLAVAGTEGELIIGRDSHKSVVAGLVFSGLQPRWVPPRWDARLHLSHPPSPEAYERAWERHPDAAAALLVSPSPYGTCADVEAIADACHARGKPLIVDEAWGAHLPFHEDLPTWAMNAGADVCVVSVHKMGAGFEQGSVFHVQGDLVDAAHLASCADLLMTTSPSVLVYTALDGWRRQMVQHGHQLLDGALRLAADVRRQVDRIAGLNVLHDELLEAEASHDLDLLQVLITVAGLGISGYQAADWLREHCRLDVGLSDHQRILATLSMADDESTARRLLDGLAALAEAAPAMQKPSPIDIPAPEDLELEQVLTPREAFFAPAELVSVKEAANRIAAEQITPYPPGIPVAVPGERLNTQVLDYLRSGLAAGMVLPDATDKSLDSVRVVRGR